MYSIIAMLAMVPRVQRKKVDPLISLERKKTN
jgi:hypothetical protein